MRRGQHDVFDDSTKEQISLAPRKTPTLWKGLVFLGLGLMGNGFGGDPQQLQNVFMGQERGAHLTVCPADGPGEQNMLGTVGVDAGIRILPLRDAGIGLDIIDPPDLMVFGVFTAHFAWTGGGEQTAALTGRATGGQGLFLAVHRTGTHGVFLVGVDVFETIAKRKPIQAGAKILQVRLELLQPLTKAGIGKLIFGVGPLVLAVVKVLEVFAGTGNIPARHVVPADGEDLIVRIGDHGTHLAGKTAGVGFGGESDLHTPLQRSGLDQAGIEDQADVSHDGPLQREGRIEMLFGIGDEHIGVLDTAFHILQQELVGALNVGLLTDWVEQGVLFVLDFVYKVTFFVVGKGLGGKQRPADGGIFVPVDMVDLLQV